MRSIDLLRPVVNNDLTGFQFGNYHSSQFGLVRVSNGSRYSEYLSPTFKNTTVDTVGAEGTLYFGRQDTTRTFQVELAFDSVTESELRDIKEWLNSGVQELVFDERPYVAYYCTLSTAPQIKYLTFYENYVRIYKGEISVNFISYYPYGFSVEGKKFADDFIDGNFDEWADASRLVNRSFIDGQITHTYDKYEATNKKIYMYNCGDFETNFTLNFKYTNTFTEAITAKILYDSTTDTDQTIEFKLPVTKTDAQGNLIPSEVQLNSKLGILYIDNNIASVDFGFTKLEEQRHYLYFMFNTPAEPIGASFSLINNNITIAYKNKFR